MMGYIFQAIIIVGYLAALIGTLIKAVNDEDWRWLVAFAALFTLMVALVIKNVAEEKEQGPCLKEETSYSYNSATKTMMPYTHCVERGTWVK